METGPPCRCGWFTQANGGGIHALPAPRLRAHAQTGMQHISAFALCTAMEVAAAKLAQPSLPRRNFGQPRTASRWCSALQSAPLSERYMQSNGVRVDLRNLAQLITRRRSGANHWRGGYIAAEN